MRTSLGLALLGLLTALGAGVAHAEEMKGRWRVEFHVGGMIPGDSLPSPSANQESGTDSTGTQIVIQDPRPNWSSTIATKLSTKGRIDLRASYGIAAYRNAELVLDFGVGYYKSTLNNIQLSWSLDRQDPDYLNQDWFDPDLHDVRHGVTLAPCENFAPELRNTTFIYACRAFLSDPGGDPRGIRAREYWRTELVEGGALQVYPVSVGLSARFRPSKRFNPYIGANVGVMIVKFKESGRWKEIADDLGNSWVDYVVRKSDDLVGGRGLASESWGPLADGTGGHPMQRPNIDAPDTLFLELKAGTEWQWKPKVWLFFESRFSWAQNGITITADGREQFGKSTPNMVFRSTRTLDAYPYGGQPAYVFKGGLHQALRDANHNDLGNGPWSGEYYLNGGQLDYGGWSFAVGMRVAI